MSIALDRRHGLWDPPRKNLWRRIIAHRYVYAMAFPSVVIYIICYYLPMGGVSLAFKEFDFSKGLWGSPWVGCKVFQDLFQEPDFWRACRNSITISLLKLICGFPIPIILALFLNEVRGKYLKRTIQTATFLPNLLSWAVLGVVFAAVFSQTQGYLNAFVNALFGKRIDFLHDPAWFRTTIVTTYIWFVMGYAMVIYMAGLTVIEPELYEVAMLDGAGRFRQMIHISLPGLMPVILTQLILSVGWIMYAGFEQVIVMYSPLVFEVGDIIETYVYRFGLRNVNYSLGAAAGLFQAVIGVTLMLVVNQISKKMAGRSIF